MALTHEALKRQAGLWDQLSGRGPFTLVCDTYPLEDGTLADSIHVFIKPGTEAEEVFVVLHPGTGQERKAQIVKVEGESRLLEEGVEFPFA